MSGQHKGLQRRVRHVSPFSIYINCRNHRLALCFVHLLKTNDLLSEVDVMLLTIWKTFHYSPKKLAVFKNMQEMYDQRQLSFVKAAATRWLSHLHACQRFVARYETLLDSLIQDVQEPELQGIRASMMRKDIVAMVLVLTDVLKPVNILSLYLQEDCGIFAELPAKVQTCTEELEGIIDRYRREDWDDLEYKRCPDLYFIIDERSNLARRMRRQDGEGQMTPASALQDIGIPLVYSLIGEVEDAFTVSDNTLRSFSFLNPTNLPEDIMFLGDYGQHQAQTLAQFYGSEKVDNFEGHRTVAPPDFGNADVLLAQLLDFRRQLFMYKEAGHDTMEKVYAQMQVDAIVKRAFPYINDIYKLALLIPQSTAVVERGFSLMNNIATTQRTLLQNTLDALMRVSSFSSNRTLTENDFDQLVELFKSSRPRLMPL